MDHVRYFLFILSLACVPLVIIWKLYCWSLRASSLTCMKWLILSIILKKMIEYFLADGSFTLQLTKRRNAVMLYICIVDSLHNLWLKKKLHCCISLPYETQHGITNEVIKLCNNNNFCQWITWRAFVGNAMSWTFIHVTFITTKMDQINPLLSSLVSTQVAHEE